MEATASSNSCWYCGCASVRELLGMCSLSGYVVVQWEVLCGACIIGCVGVRMHGSVLFV